MSDQADNGPGDGEPASTHEPALSHDTGSAFDAGAAGQGVGSDASGPGPSGHEPPGYGQPGYDPSGYGQQGYGPPGYGPPPYPPQGYGQPYPVYGYPMAPPRKEPALSLVVSFLIPGVGSMINGDVSKGVGILVGFVASVILTLVIIGIFGVIGFWVWGMVDAYNGAVAYNRRVGYPG